MAPFAPSPDPAPCAVADDPTVGPTDGPERALAAQAGRLAVAGVDEAGRGPLAGPVIAAAVILDLSCPIEGLKDSKQLAAPRRADLAQQIRRHAVAWAVAEASVAEIDRLNILQASLLAMRRAVAALDPAPVACLVDGNRLPDGLPGLCQALPKADGLSLSVAAASILAKTHRDTLMTALHTQFPDYGWDKNAGYGVPAHLAALERAGPCVHHRRSFAPVARLLKLTTSD